MRSRRSRSPTRSCRSRSIRSRASTRAGPNARTTGNIANPGIDVKSFKWTARDFAAAADGQMPMGEPVREWSFGDVDAGLKSAKLVLDESFVTQGLSHHSMESRTALAYWQNGKCHLHASSQSQSLPVPGVARFIGIEPQDLVFIAEFCGGGFGSKGGAYPIVAVPALLSKKIGRPVMMRISRHEEYYLGSARAGFQGRVKIGFRADGRVTAVDLYIVQENGPNTGFNDWLSAADAVSIVYQPAAMRFRGVPVMTNTPPRGPQRGPGQNQIAMAIEPIIDKAARQLGLDRVEIRRDQRARQHGQDRRDAGRPHERVSARGARAGRGEVRLGRAARAQRPAQRHEGDRRRRRHRVSTPRAATASTASCGSRRTASSTSIRASAISARTRTRRRRASRPKC